MNEEYCFRLISDDSVFQENNLQSSCTTVIKASGNHLVFIFIFSIYRIEYNFKTDTISTKIYRMPEDANKNKEDDSGSLGT